MGDLAGCLVAVDLAAKKRVQTPFYGSFPGIYGNYVVFTSDPTFVMASDEAEFTQIKTYALYAYHVRSGGMCLVKKYGFPVVVE